MKLFARGRREFVHRSKIRSDLQSLQTFHEDPGALQRLTPPGLPMKIVQDERRSITEGDVLLRMGPGPVSLRWLARHEPGPTASSFTDRLIDGPLAHWEHQHIFEPLDEGVALIDRISLEHRPGWRGILTRLLFDGPALTLLFRYRHWRTRKALEDLS
ncbi:MAG: SRPBCC family protein [Anaerolineaceae bacterium]|nr:SRPBCC family protein [Anaerolineaceae bacterium]MCY4024275.1 SRPBCC family protein [Anaerolineaceae bacterium]